MAEITKKELEQSVAKEVNSSLTAVFKSVMPDITKNTKEQVDNFERALTTGTGKKIDKSLEGLNKFIENDGEYNVSSAEYILKQI